MKARMVKLIPSCLNLPFSSPRQASSSVISAKSNCVTCGIKLFNDNCGTETCCKRVIAATSPPPNALKSGNAGKPEATAVVLATGVTCGAVRRVFT